jgi:DNA-binding GntR family transcriptional regulator
MEPLVNPPSDESPAGDRRTLAERAYISLRDMIVTLRMPPGSPIHEERLSQTLGVGRTPVREAIKRLEAEGLVAIYPRRGTFVTEINITDHGLIAEVRRVLEGQAAASAVDRATTAEREELVALAARAGGAVTGHEDLMRLDTDIHRALYRCTHNKYLAGTLAEYYNLTLRIWYLFLPRLSAMSEHIAEHGPLVERIVAGDAEGARALAIDHVTHFEEAVLRALAT